MYVMLGFQVEIEYIMQANSKLDIVDCLNCECKYVSELHMYVSMYHGVFGVDNTNSWKWDYCTVWLVKDR